MPTRASRRRGDISNMSRHPVPARAAINTRALALGGRAFRDRMADLAPSPGERSAACRGRMRRRWHVRRCRQVLAEANRRCGPGDVSRIYAGTCDTRLQPERNRAASRCQSQRRQQDAAASRTRQRTRIACQGRREMAKGHDLTPPGKISWVAGAPLHRRASDCRGPHLPGFPAALVRRAHVQHRHVDAEGRAGLADRYALGHAVGVLSGAGQFPRRAPHPAASRSSAASSPIAGIAAT